MMSRRVTVQTGDKAYNALKRLVVAKMMLEKTLEADCDSVTGQLACVHSAFAEQGIDIVYEGNGLSDITSDIWTEVKKVFVIK